MLEPPRAPLRRYWSLNGNDNSIEKLRKQWNRPFWLRCDISAVPHRGALDWPGGTPIGIAVPSSRQSPPTSRRRAADGNNGTHYNETENEDVPVYSLCRYRISRVECTNCNISHVNRTCEVGNDYTHLKLSHIPMQELKGTRY
jgi:hypothetical protein